MVETSLAQTRLLTPMQIAERLQISERTITQWLRKGHLRGFKIGKEWRVSEGDLNAFLEAKANIPEPEVSRNNHGKGLS